MKPTGVTPRPTLVTTWPRKPNRRAVLDRIQTLTQELESIQSEMHGQLTGAVAGMPGNFFEDAEAVEVLNKFKAELDQLRRILWFYVGEAAAGTNTKDQASRNEGAAGPSRTLVPQAGGPSQGAEPGWFFDRLNLVIESYMQEKKPVVPEPKTFPRANAKAFS